MSSGRHPMPSQPVAASRVAAAVAATCAAAWVFYELRARGSARAGHTPPTLTHEWQAAQEKRLGGGMERQAAPGTVSYHAFIR